jgi:putative DNA primase/helicase
MSGEALAERVRRVKEAAEGRWIEILTGAGIPEALLARDNRPCPLCGGRDRFTFFRREPGGRWFCRGCGHGDGIALLQRFRHESFGATLRYLEERLGVKRAWLPKEEWLRVRAERRAAEDAAGRARRRLEALWNEAQPLSELDRFDPVMRYLSARGLPLGAGDLSAELRSHPLLDYFEGGEDARVHERWPAMLARVSDEGGRLVSLHRTYLRPDGSKAPVAAQKKLTKGALETGLVRLFAPRETLGIAEGIETALAARALSGIPVWSAVSVGGYARLKNLPEGVRCLVVFGDRDESFAGQKGAYELAERIGREHPGVRVEVRLPPETGADWNDVLLAKSAH